MTSTSSCASSTTPSMGQFYTHRPCPPSRRRCRHYPPRPPTTPPRVPRLRTPTPSHGSGPVWTFLGSRIRIKTYADPKH